jgi:parallel beta-helix repeat protein
MRWVITLMLLIWAPLLFFGCSGEDPVGLSEQALAPLFDVDEDAADDDGCPPADHVANDEAGLLAAVAAAIPGDVIGVNGTIELDAALNLSTEGLTLTCASPGSGLVGASRSNELLSVEGANITVERLVLDGTQVGTQVGGISRPYTARGAAVAPRLSNNRVICGDACADVWTASDAVVVNNTFVASNANIQYGVQARNTSGSTLIKGNEITTTEPSIISIWGAIRLIRAPNAEVRENEIRGPWWSGMALAVQDGTVIRDNEIEGAQFNGIRLTWVSNSKIIDNEIQNSGEIGILVRSVFEGSVDNTLRKNEIKGSGSESCHDDNVGSGTAGTANEWEDNEGEAPSNPGGICGDDDDDDD